MKRSITHFAFLFIAAGCFAQNESEVQSYRDKKLPSFIPASPNASGISRLAEIKANNYVGRVDIAIPIYTIGLKQLSIPVYLGYNSSGIKVEEYAPSTGIGWSLNAGGVITRAVRNKPDDGPVGYLSSASLGSSGLTTVGGLVDMYVRDQLNTTDKELFERQASDGDLDTEPDTYNYSFPGGSGKFFITPGLKIITIPYEPLKITQLLSGGFSITDTRGNRFEFQAQESTLTHTTSYNGETNTTSNNLNPEQTITSWHLSKIITVNNEEIIYTYGTATINPSYNAQQAKYFLAESNLNSCCVGFSSPFLTNYHTTSVIHQQIVQRKITNIEFPNGSIEFNYTQARTDLSGDHALTNIKIKNETDTIKEFNLDYEYYSNRIFLSEVQESSKGQVIPPYKIEYYNPSQLPDRTSYAQDFWGYYNGATNNPNLIPASPNNFGASYVFFPPILGDANRQPDADKMKYGSIGKLIHPTGGSSEFEFEPHVYAKIKNTDVSETLYSYSNSFINAIGNTSGTPVYSNTFNIEFHQNVTIDFNVYGNEVSVQLLEVTSEGDQLIFVRNGNNITPQTGTSVMALLPGTYRLRAFNYEEEFTATISAQFQSRTVSGTVNEKIGGGIRIKKIVDRDSITGQANTREFIYKSSFADSKSSGVLLDFPTYDYFQNSIKVMNCTPGAPIEEHCYLVSQYYVKLSSPSLATGLTHGSYVGYKSVIIRSHAQNAQGYAVKTFRSPDENIDQDFTGFPFTSAISKDQKRGQVKSEKIYDKDDFKLLTDSSEYLSQDYVAVNNLDYVAAGANVAYHLRYPEPYYQLSQWTSQKYFLFSEFVKQNRSLKISKDVSGGELNTDTRYYYDNVKHLMPTRIETVNSKGQKITAYNSFPHDYASGTPFIQAMIDKNIIANNIESVVTSQKGGDTSIISGTISEYKQNDPAVQDKIHLLNIASPVSLSQFKFSNKVAGTLSFPGETNSVYQKDLHYKEKMDILASDANGNILTHRMTSDHPVSYLWNYDSQYPVANVINASQGDIAYTSFEGDAKGNWSYSGTASPSSESITGSRLYDLSAGDISRTNLNVNIEYTLTYWIKNASPLSITGTQGDAVQLRALGDWKCFQHRLGNILELTISGNGLIDELRLHPRVSQMTTYTYEPLIGMTSQCDVANRIAYYEYDVFGRLKLVRDQDKNILKTFDYKYQANTNQ